MALINVITTGYVIQVFDDETGEFVSQDFFASDDVSYEYAEDGESINCPEVIEKIPYLCFDMKQPL